MIVSKDGYYLDYEPKRNRIVISLPQTMKTLETTEQKVSNRKIEATNQELNLILNVVRFIFNEEQPSEGGTGRERTCESLEELRI